MSLHKRNIQKIIFGVALLGQILCWNRFVHVIRLDFLKQIMFSFSYIQNIFDFINFLFASTIFKSRSNIQKNYFLETKLSSHHLQVPTEVLYNHYAVYKEEENEKYIINFVKDVISAAYIHYSSYFINNINFVTNPL
uniref:Uncharacterized protein n=1 Tax=Panstrongylus lignarius TaxID=156445 RepID=A0A224Y0Z7_9HEMI